MSGNSNKCFSTLGRLFIGYTFPINILSQVWVAAQWQGVCRWPETMNISIMLICNNNNTFLFQTIIGYRYFSMCNFTSTVNSSCKNVVKGREFQSVATIVIIRFRVSASDFIRTIWQSSKQYFRKLKMLELMMDLWRRG
jgi:hypothetical protein